MFSYSFIVFSNTSSWVFSAFCPACFLPFSPLSSMGFCTLHFHPFSMYFSKGFTRLLHFPVAFAPFPLVVIKFSCTFTVFFHYVYCIVTVCSQHSLQFPPFSMGFCTISSDRSHVFLQFHCIFQYLFVGFNVFCPAFFYCMLPTIFTSFLHGFLHHFLWFPAFSCIFNVFFQGFYPSPSFSDGFCTISSGCYHIFLHFHGIFPAF